MTTMLQNHFINHISLIVDASSSMSDQPVVKVFDKELAFLKRRSIELNQETRISIYLFGSEVRCLTFDMDVMRFNSLQGFWKPCGMTKLMDAVLHSIRDHRQLPELYGDHAYLQYVITDGEENNSKEISPAGLKAMLDELPGHWTTACLVPTATSKHEAKRFGFTEDSIAIWDTSKSDAFEGIGQQFSSAVDQYMQNRAQGVRGTRSFFAKIDTSKLSTASLALMPRSKYNWYKVLREGPIKDFVEFHTGSYQLGKAFYEPTKTIEIQKQKSILVMKRSTGEVYTAPNIRSVLGLPYDTAKVEPSSNKEWVVLVQSTSVNRKLFPGQSVLVLQ